MESKSTAGSSVSPSSSKPPTNTQDISPSKEKQQSTSKPTVENTNPATTDDSVKPKSKKKSVDKTANAATTAVDSSNATQTANNSTKLKRNKYKYCISSSELDPDAESSSFSDSCGSSLYGPRSNEDRRDYVLWEFLNEQGIWKPYDPLITRLVESQRRKVPVVKLREVDPKMCNIVIDFKAMQQIRCDYFILPARFLISDPGIKLARFFGQTRLFCSSVMLDLTNMPCLMPENALPGNDRNNWGESMNYYSVPVFSGRQIGFITRH